MTHREWLEKHSGLPVMVDDYQLIQGDVWIDLTSMRREPSEDDDVDDVFDWPKVCQSEDAVRFSVYGVALLEARQWGCGSMPFERTLEDAKDLHLLYGLAIDLCERMRADGVGK